MAAVPVTIVGTLTDNDGSKNVTLAGLASLTGLEVGGGPLPGGDGGLHPEHPIYWPSPGHPEHPIYLPPGIWPNPPEGQAPIPMPPIYIPPPAGSPPNTPRLEVKTVWTLREGWQVVLVPTGEHPTPSAAPPASGSRR